MNIVHHQVCVLVVADLAVGFTGSLAAGLDSTSSRRGVFDPGFSIHSKEM